MSITGTSVSPGGWRSWSPGVRVVVRRVRDDLPEAHPEHPALHVPQHSDVLGELLEVDDDGVLVRTRRGDVRVPAQDIVLTKLVPPAPTRRHRPTGD
ncbi:hypothetical protein [Cellulomonas fengjieae]|uniref:Uncharacterized protein n=1 Tax=Cellulomonas fengjieae TaxID=2819978 RepID=A0ABS3SL32_9CELL|nr:hypothetical protein [Cellulomonas fengjieae]MBO3086454.1 hypothetical protein [Cellulomonas fengjieae]QVI66682.1 hypothetical protein KG102_03525 [Cellulomonas fengjieae]